MEINEMADKVYAWAKRKGWEPDEERTFGEAIALIHSEASEALEAYRQWHLADATDDRGMMLLFNPSGLPKPEGVGSEFADILIRLLHYSKAYGIDLEHEFKRKMAYNEQRPFRHGGKHL